MEDSDSESEQTVDFVQEEYDFKLLIQNSISCID